MLVNTKAKVGVFSIALGAYLPQFPSLVPEFEAQYEAFKKTIPDTVEIIPKQISCNGHGIFTVFCHGTILIKQIFR